MALEQVVSRYAERQAALARRTSTELVRLWRQIEPGQIVASWGSMLPRALAVLGTSQATAAASAGLYVDDVLEASGVRVDQAAAGRVSPAAFAATASDGRPLASLLMEPSITTLTQIKAGRTPAQALNSGRFALDMITRTQVADAGRVAVSTAAAVRPQVTGYVRMISGGACSRCLILAGKRYRWNTGFQRHPRCECRNVPVAESVPDDLRVNPKAYFDSLGKTEQDQLLGQAGAEAVRSGADLAKVVNARRGMQTASVFGRQVHATTEGARRGVRLMPEQIFRDASSRDDAIRLLRLHGYII